MRITPERLAEIESREKAATPGPWSREKPAKDADGFATGVGVAATYGRQMIYAPLGGTRPSADATFIASARTDIPDLIADLKEAQEPKWACFHCGFETNDQAEAMAHFGDDMHEPLALCQHWTSWKDHEKAHEFQQLTLELNGTREEAEKQRAEIEGLEYRLAGLESVLDSRFPGCKTLNDVFHLYDTLEGEKLAAQEQLEEAKRHVKRLYEQFQGKEACGDFTCCCNSLGECGLCESRKENEDYLRGAK